MSVSFGFIHVLHSMLKANSRLSSPILIGFGGRLRLANKGCVMWALVGISIRSGPFWTLCYMTVLSL